jgi:hypothetical protein
MNAPAPDPASPRNPDDFFAAVYEELRSIAHARMRHEQPGHTLQTTELVHEACLRRAPKDGSKWANRRHFFAEPRQAGRRRRPPHGLPTVKNYFPSPSASVSRSHSR